jgi:hypothetical protein
MVHALRGIWRVLAGSGILVDLRPLSGQCPIEFVIASTVIRIGDVDATGMAADDAASDRAVQDAVTEGHFLARQDSEFDFDLYWDNVQEMASFMESSRRMKEVRPSYADLEQAYLAKSAEGPEKVRLRCRR